MAASCSCEGCGESWPTISLAIIVAFGTSLAATVGLFQVEVWREFASLISIMVLGHWVLGHWLEMRAISQARGALTALAALLPDTAERITDAEVRSVGAIAMSASTIIVAANAQLLRYLKLRHEAT